VSLLSTPLSGNMCVPFLELGFELLGYTLAALLDNLNYSGPYVNGEFCDVDLRGVGGGGGCLRRLKLVRVESGSDE
jgi:hypothetical protein